MRGTNQFDVICFAREWRKINIMMWGCWNYVPETESHVFEQKPKESPRRKCSRGNRREGLLSRFIYRKDACFFFLCTEVSAITVRPAGAGLFVIPQYCFSSCLLNKYSQLIDSSDRHERSPNAYQIISRGHHCSILDVDAAMGRICDWIFAVILVFFLTKGISSNEGKASHWLLVCVVILTRLRGVILAGRMTEIISLIWR